MDRSILANKTFYVLWKFSRVFLSRKNKILLFGLFSFFLYYTVLALWTKTQCHNNVYYFNFHINEDFLQNFVSLIHFLSHMTECIWVGPNSDQLTNELQQLFLNCNLSLDLRTLRDHHLTSLQMNKQCPCLYSHSESYFVNNLLCVC